MIIILTAWFDKRIRVQIFLKLYKREGYTSIICVGNLPDSRSSDSRSDTWSSNSRSSGGVDLLSGSVALLPDAWSSSNIGLFISCRHIAGLFISCRYISCCVCCSLTDQGHCGVLCSSGVLISSDVLIQSTLNIHGLSSGISCLVLTALNSSLERLFRVVNDLSFNWNILILLNFSFPGNVFNSLLRDVLWDVLSQILNGIIVSFGDLSWNALDSLLFSIFSYFSGLGHSLDSDFILILDDLLLEWNVLDSALTLDHFFSSVDSCVDNLGSLSETLIDTIPSIALIVSSGCVTSLIDITSCIWVSILITLTVKL